MILVATTAKSLFNTTRRRSRPSFLSTFLLRAPFWNDVPVLLLNYSNLILAKLANLTSFLSKVVNCSIKSDQNLRQSVMKHIWTWLYRECAINASLPLTSSLTFLRWRCFLSVRLHILYCAWKHVIRRISVRISRTRYCFLINGSGKEARWSLALERARWPIYFIA